MEDNKISTQERMLLLVEQWRHSGLPKKAFCIQHKVANATFHYWYNKYKTKDVPNLSPFIPVRVKAEASVTPKVFAELTLTDGRKLTLYHFIEASFLKSLLS